MPRSGSANLLPFPLPLPRNFPPHITDAFVISHNVNLYSVQSKQIAQKKNEVIHTD